MFDTVMMSFEQRTLRTTPLGQLRLLCGSFRHPAMKAKARVAM